MTLKITQTENKHIKQSLPYLNRLLNGDEKIELLYNKTAISIFDHWLEPEETEKIFIKDLKEIQERRRKFKDAVGKLYNSTQIYFWRNKRHQRFFLYKPTSLEMVLKNCDFENLDGYRGRHYCLILPEFSAIFQEEWDWTNILWFRDGAKIQPILDIVNESGLNVI